MHSSEEKTELLILHIPDTFSKDKHLTSSCLNAKNIIEISKTSWSYTMHWSTPGISCYAVVGTNTSLRDNRGVIMF